MAIDYLRLTSLEDNNVISINNPDSRTNTVNIEYRTDLNPDWQSYSIGTQLTLFNGSWVEFRNSTGSFSRKFSISKKAEVTGDLSTLLDYNNPGMNVPANGFSESFKSQPITKCPRLTSKVISQSGLSGLCSGCPELVEVGGFAKFTWVGNGAMWGAFGECPKLKKLKLASQATNTNCFRSLCNSSPLLEEIDLDITFSSSSDKSALQKAFQGCSSLKKIIWRSPNFTSNLEMFDHTPGGVFLYTDKNLDISSIPRDINGIPSSYKIVYLNEDLNLSIDGKKVANLSIDGTPVRIIGENVWKGVEVHCSSRQLNNNDV